jgi:uncharacterized protein YndB with AHSA1/START domain
MVDILHRVGVEAPASRVFDAITTQAGLAGWWTRGAKAEPHAGAVLTFPFANGSVTMKVVELVPDRRVVWQCLSGAAEWIGTTLIFELRRGATHDAARRGVDGDAETELFFAHRGWRDAVPFMHHCSTKWALFLVSLKSLVEEGVGQPYPDDRKLGRTS